MLEEVIITRELYDQIETRDVRTRFVRSNPSSPNIVIKDYSGDILNTIVYSLTAVR